jgi:glutaminyl-peptide cyclotransferase
MSNGSAEITRRDPDTFEPMETYTVTVEGSPVEDLNELECVDDSIYANVYQTDYIVRFDKSSGEIDAVIDATDLRLPEEVSGNVLNGIAYDPANDWFYITGKYWPKMYRVRFVPAS